MYEQSYVVSVCVIRWSMLAGVNMGWRTFLVQTTPLFMIEGITQGLLHIHSWLHSWHRENLILASVFVLPRPARRPAIGLAETADVLITAHYR